jgi:hypothetical protein
MDTNVNNYTIPELLTIIGLEDESSITSTDILSKTNEYIYRFKNEYNNKLSHFFQDVQTKLLQYENQLQQKNNPPIYSPNTKQTNEWYKYEALPQDNEVQQDKITDRFQKIQVYDNQHVPMKREQLGVNNIIDTKVAQDILNPNLENITTRFINLDSQFRQYSGGIESISTDYTLDLSDLLKDVLSLRLYSYQIPYNWYAIDSNYGNTCFWITDINLNLNVPVYLSEGNYTSSQFVTELNSAFVSAGFTFTETTDISANSPVVYNTYNGKITIYLNGGVYLDSIETLKTISFQSKSL